MKVAIVCDWLTGIGGAERVVLELHKMFPDAPIYTSQYNPNKIDWFKDADVRTTWLQKLPKSLKKFLPVLRAWAFTHLDLSDYDLVISSSGAEAKAVKTGSKTIHIWYCLAPTHYYWSRYEQYLKNPGFGLLDPIARIGLRSLIGPMRRWDYKAAQKPNFVVAISTHIKDEVQKYYNRESSIIFPPVDTQRFSSASEEPRRGFVAAGRQTPYKRIDLAVRAFTKLKLPLLVLGNGPDHSKLQKIAGDNITFIKNPSDERVAQYFKTSLAFIFPGLDDFGIVAVEALAAGTPVIAYKGGGALDYINQSNGLFFDLQETDSLIEAVNKFNAARFDHAKIEQSAKQFSPENFQQKFHSSINKLVP